jgi:hypothetical protein
MNTTMNTTTIAPESATESAETITADEAVAIVTTLHSEVLGITAETDLSHKRADALLTAARVDTTTELLLLLARFHTDVDDAAGAAMLARFAVEFAALEATVI